MWSLLYLWSSQGCVVKRLRMVKLVKTIIPLSVRVKLKWLWFALHDIKQGPVEPRVPSRRKTFIGGGDFISVGENFFKTMKRYGLTENMDVLDVGCGQGRMARPLIGFFNKGSYRGFDIVRSGIEWCQREYIGAGPFEFSHADVYNKRYNKTGKVAAADFKFPFPDDSFDRVFLTSVFTHMFAKDVENYLSEVSRVMRPNGKALITWFLLDEVSRQSQNQVLNFNEVIDDVSRTTVKSNPEAAIAFDLGYVVSLYQKNGLSIEDIEYGTWGRADSQYSLQDLIIATK